MPAPVTERRAPGGAPVSTSVGARVRAAGPAPPGDRRGRLRQAEIVPRREDAVGIGFQRADVDLAAGPPREAGTALVELEGAGRRQAARIDGVAFAPDQRMGR